MKRCCLTEISSLGCISTMKSRSQSGHLDLSKRKRRDAFPSSAFAETCTSWGARTTTTTKTSATTATRFHFEPANLWHHITKPSGLTKLCNGIWVVRPNGVLRCSPKEASPCHSIYLTIQNSDGLILYWLCTILLIYHPKDKRSTSDLMAPFISVWRSKIE